MFCNIFGLPRPLDPAVVPWVISFSKHSPSFRMICPKYAIFLLFTDFSKSLSTPAVSITQLFVFDTLRTCCKLFISNSSNTNTPGWPCDCSATRYCQSLVQFLLKLKTHFTQRRRSRGSRAFIGSVRMCVCMSALWNKNHWTYHQTSCRWIVHDKSWSPIMGHFIWG